jgi:hypothetical protein
LYLPAIAVAAWPRRERQLREPVVYAICWFAAIFVFFSVSHGKCLVYILPAFPPLAALTGWAVSDALESDLRTTLRRAIAIASSVIAIGTAAVIIVALGAVAFGIPTWVVQHLHPTDRRFLTIFTNLTVRWSPALLIWLGASIVAAGAILYGTRRGNVAIQLTAVGAVAALGSFFWFGTMNSALERQETLEGFTREVIKTVPRDMTIGHIGIEDCGIYFYSPRPIEPVFRFKCDANPPFPSYIVIRQSRFNELAEPVRACLKPILQSPAVDSAGPRLLVEQISPAQ